MNKKELRKKLSEGNYNFLRDYLIIEYEELKERLVDLLDPGEVKIAQGSARVLRDLLQLTKQK